MSAAETNGSQPADLVKNENRNYFPGPGSVIPRTVRTCFWSLVFRAVLRYGLPSYDFSNVGRG